MEADFPTVEVMERAVLSDGFYRLERVGFEQRGDGGTQRLDREVYHNGPGAAVLPIDPERGTVLLVRQLRIAAHLNGDPAWLTECCAGMVDGTDAPADTVRKEAEQELGVRLDQVRPALTLYMNPGTSSEKVHLFLARYGRESRIGDGGGLDEEGERIRVLELDFEEALAMVRRGEIVDAKTVALLQHARLGAAF